ncbi:MAG TPA: guanitoxin biosynthesis heme-dependent pre-guanitoxin N-hydroxylase GntA [Legionella sp.]|nr:guanitoxin biosynthesis heme-dependent pre-guanitoxin N-hydroxylase GntA [Legionella sp.]
MPHSLEAEFLNFIQDPQFPCIGAKAAAKKGLIEILIAPDLRSDEFDSIILNHIYLFIERWELQQESLQTLAIIFNHPQHLTELQFETLLWERLQKLHNLDSKQFSWDPQVNKDVMSSDFSFSLGGHGFFIVGMHSGSSRQARRFSHPSLVFNLHEQFERLREEHVFEQMRDKIRDNEIKNSGNINPMVGDYGVFSEAIQYSGRNVSKKHHCPFMVRVNAQEWEIIAPKSALAFKLPKGSILTVQDPYGEQVADLFCFSSLNKEEFLSSGRSIDYENKIYFTKGDSLYSNLSNKMLTIIEDDVGVHDFLFTPCNRDTFRILYNEENTEGGCHENLIKAFAPYEFPSSYIGTTFNIFMNVIIESDSGELKILPPKSKKGDTISFQSDMDLIVGLTACSAKKSNNNSLKPIHFKINHKPK